jgi:hypothetical protein
MSAGHSPAYCSLPLLCKAWHQIVAPARHCPVSGCRPAQTALLSPRCSRLAGSWAAATAAPLTPGAPLGGRCGLQDSSTHICRARLRGHCLQPIWACMPAAVLNTVQQKSAGVRPPVHGKTATTPQVSQNRCSSSCDTPGSDQVLAVAAAAYSTCVPPSRCSLCVWKCSCCGTALTVTVLCPGLSSSELSTDLPAAGHSSKA